MTDENGDKSVGEQEASLTVLRRTEGEGSPKEPNSVLTIFMVIGAVCLWLIFMGLLITIGELVLRVFAALFPLLLIAGVAAYIVLCVQGNTFTPWDKS